MRFGNNPSSEHLMVVMGFPPHHRSPTGNRSPVQPPVRASLMETAELAAQRERLGDRRRGLALDFEVLRFA
jgi:hypothetical protein